MSIAKEKLIAIAVAAAVGLGMLYLVLKTVVFNPAADLNQKLQDTAQKLEQKKKQNSRKDALAKEFRDYAAHTLGTDEAAMRITLKTRVRELMNRCGVQEVTRDWSEASGDLIRTPKEVVAKPVGWKFTVSGSLPQVVSLLDSLESKDERYLHRIEKLVMTPKGRNVEASITLLTLALAPRPKEVLTTMPAGTLPGEAPKQPEEYAIIAARDIFRPYIKKPPAPPQHQPPQHVPPVRQPDVPPVNPPRPEAIENSWIVKDISTYGDEPEVGLVQPDGNIKRFKCGQQLAGGTIVLIDYRALPLLDKPDTRNWGRMILLIGQQYFAVERGKAIREKYLVPDDRLPPELPALSAPPAEPQPALTPTTEPAVTKATDSEN